MDIKIEIIISCILSAFILLGAIRIHFFKKETMELPVSLISLLSILFGFYLWIKNGIILDYGTPEEINQTHTPMMVGLGVANAILGLLFIIISIIPYTARSIKRVRKIIQYRYRTMSLNGEKYMKRKPLE
jgi:hypothetical protein